MHKVALAQARMWFTLAGAAALLPLPVGLVVAVQQSAYNRITPAGLFGTLPDLLLVAAGFSLLWALREAPVEPGKPSWVNLSRLVALAVAAMALVAVTQAATELLQRDGPSVGAWLAGKVVWLAQPAAYGGLAFLLSVRRSEERAPRHAVVLGAVFGASSWLTHLVERLLPYEVLARHGDDVRVFAHSVLVLALVVVARKKLGDAGGLAEDAPEPWRPAVRAMRLGALWLRVRALAVLLFIGASAVGLAARVQLQAGAGAVTLALIAVLTGPLLLLCMVRLRRAPEARLKGPATLAAVLLVLRAFGNAVLVLFAFDGLRHNVSRSDLQIAATSCIGVLLFGTMVDSALLVAARRMGEQLGHRLATGGLQLLLWGGTLGWVLFCSGINALARNDSHRAEEFAMWVTLAASALALGLPYRVTRAMRRATGLDLPATAPPAAPPSTPAETTR